MNSTALNKKRITIITIGVITLLFLGTWSIGIFKKDTITPPSEPLRNPQIQRVFIKDFHKLDSSITASDRANIEERLYHRASQTKPDLFTGVIRPSSYTNTKMKSVRIINLLIDVDPIKETYLVTIKKIQGRSSIDIECAQDDQQMVTPSSCENGEYR